MYDRRLMGTWKSDARRTLREIRTRGDISDDRKRRFKGVFGKLELRYTRTRIHSSFGTDLQTVPYRVLGKDADSVCIEFRSAEDGETHLQHLHFVGDHYWVGMGSFREWFRKVADAPARAKGRGS